MEWLKGLLGKYGWQIGLAVFAGLFAWRMLMPPEVKTVERLIVDTKWQESMTQKVNSLVTAFATQMSTIHRDLETYKQMAKDMKIVQSTVEKYDPVSGKLVERILSAVTDSHSTASSSASATTSATNTATSGSTASASGSTVSTGAGTSHSVDTTTTTKNPQAIVSLFIGAGFKTIDGFNPSDIDLGAHINVFGLKVTAMESYEFLGGREFKDRLKTHLAVTVMELK